MFEAVTRLLLKFSAGLSPNILVLLLQGNQKVCNQLGKCNLLPVGAALHTNQVLDWCGG